MILAQQNINNLHHNNFSRSSQPYPFYARQHHQQQQQQQQQQRQQVQQQEQQAPQPLDIDTVDSIDSDSIASSPHSTQSLLSQYSNFQNRAFDSTPSAVPRSSQNIVNPSFKLPSSTNASFEAGGNSQSLNQVPELMPSEPWLLHSQQQQTPRAAHRLGHNRDSSLSSMGSNGPASPFNTNTSNPHIAIIDSGSDGYHDLSVDDSNYSYHLGKPMTMGDNFYTTLQSLNGHGAGAADASFADGLPNMPAQQQQNHQKPKPDRSLLPAPELSSGSASRSHPVSVASSTVGGDSPATPSFHEPVDDDNRRRKNVFTNSVPKLDRTMTDIYSDELYSPEFTITSASPPQTQIAMSPSSDLFAQRLQAANSQHLSVHSPGSVSSRNQSPFRHGSPLAPATHDFSQQGSQVHLNSAQQLREKRKAEQDVKALQQQMRHSANQQQGTPSTISPKDAMLEYNEQDDASNFPLFPPQETNNFGLGQLNKVVAQQTQNFQSTTPLQNSFNFNMPSSIQLPQHYPFIARPQQPQQQQATPSVSNFSRVSSADTAGSDGDEGSTQRPARTNADGGTYTCTYHGCTLRFETPVLLQKHKREGHRQVNALNNARASSAVVSPGVPDSLLNSQAGPHRCDRINPSTGKPCNTVFSRPYDLTRHEDTIHNARKQKVRCNLCTEEKTFSRADALTRHYRVCHPDVEFPGKHRRRGVSNA